MLVEDQNETPNFNKPIYPADMKIAVIRYTTLQCKYFRLFSFKDIILIQLLLSVESKAFLHENSYIYCSI